MPNPTPTSPKKSQDRSQERREIGRLRRKQLRRQDHCNWQPQHRQHTAIALIEESMRGRVPSLVAIKYERMATSPFGFLSWSCAGYGG